MEWNAFEDCILPKSKQKELKHQFLTIQRAIYNKVHYKFIPLPKKLLYRQLEDQQVAPPTWSSFWHQECPLTKAFVLLVPFLDQTTQYYEYFKM